MTADQPRGPGRPGVGPMVNVRLPEVLIEWLDDHVATRGLPSRAEAIRYAVGEYRALIDQTNYLERTHNAKTQRERNKLADENIKNEERFRGTRLSVDGREL